jgi:hypothetical protein
VFRGTKKEDRLLIALQGYFDDSGTHDDSKVAVVGGYVSTEEQWSLFDVEWQKALDEFGIEHFHTTDFANKAPPYDEWKDDLRYRRFAQLGGIVNTHAIASVACAIPVESFNRCMSPKAKDYVGGPYGLAAFCVFGETSTMFDDWPSSKVAYILEAGTAGFHQVSKIFSETMRRPADREMLKLHSITVADKDVLPLQAADMVAYEIYKHYPRQLGIEDRRPRIENMTILSNVRRKAWVYPTDKSIRNWSWGIDWRLDNE